ncbi:MAG: helix-turn-helix domain-containing protein [Dehalococcoidales bacterium]|nr:helix-turn-helix domain-containing protein [Dehalococcoidales bacterium]
MKYLKQLRELTGLSQEDFAKRLNISRAWVAQLEANEDKQPSEELKNKIREVVLIRLLVPVRRLMTEPARIEDSDRAAKVLKLIEKSFGRDELAKRRVLLLSITDPNIVPAIVSAEWGLHLRENSLQTNNWLDIINLDDYDNLDDIESTFAKLTD